MSGTEVNPWAWHPHPDVWLLMFVLIAGYLTAAFTIGRLFSNTRRKGQVTGVGSLLWLHWTTEALTDYRSTRPKDPEAALRVFVGLINEGILLTQRGLGACSLAMSDEDVDRFVNALARVLARA